MKNVAAAPGQQAMVEDCNYFTTTLVDIDGSFHLALEDRSSFTILIATKGALEVTAPDGTVSALPQGQTLLVPAEVPYVDLKGDGEVVTVFIR